MRDILHQDLNVLKALMLNALMTYYTNRRRSSSAAATSSSNSDETDGINEHDLDGK